MAKYDKGDIIKVTVTGIEKYGAFVVIDEKYTGLIHISEISKGFVKDIHQFVRIGEVINAEVIDIDDEKNQLKLSIKNIEYTNGKRLYKIIETPHGFNTLKAKLPMWIEKSLKNTKNV